MEPRGRGRARGRARGQQQQQQQQGPRPGPPQARPPQGGPPQGRPPQGGPPQAGLPPPQQAPGQSPWGRPPHPQQVPASQPLPPSSPWVRPQVQAGPSVPIGRGARQGRGDTEVVEQPEVLQGAGDGAGVGTQESARGGGGNGGVRGRSYRNEIIHTRPEDVTKQGTSGKQIQLISNFFPLLQAGKWCLYNYRVDFQPDVDSTPLRKGYVRTGMKDIVTGYLFDGTCLYSPHRILPDPIEVFVKSDNDEVIRITVRLVGDVAWGDYHYLQLFNLIVRKCLVFMKFELVGRNFFDPHAKTSIPDHKLELWPGYYTSMRQHERSILMNVEVLTKVMRMDNVYDMLLECRGSNVRTEFLNKVLGTIVLTYYNNKTYRIDDVDYKTTPESTFPMRDGQQISFVQYYRQKYNINIQVMKQPMLVSRSKPREIRAGMPELVLLIPELCQMTGLSDRQRENFQLMRALADHTRIAPIQRMQRLMDFSKRMRGCPEVMQELRKWDLNVSDTLVRFTGRVLPPENIMGGNETKYSAGPQADWTRDLRSLPMFVCGQMQKFAVVCPSKFKGPTQDFVQLLQRAGRGMSWDIGQPRVFDIPDDRAHTYLEMMDNIIAKNKPTMIMCVVPNNSADRYKAIKKKTLVDRGIPNQVILSKNLTAKGVMSIATKVAIQLNCKIGGAPWTVSIPLSHLMIVGYDVCRDTVKKGKCFGAMVASLDRQATRYFNYVSEHPYQEELANDFPAFLILACKRYKEVQGRYPERIIIYRDGVGDGQLTYVVEHEVKFIKSILSRDIYKNNDLRMAFIVVSKRINTRIFTEQGNPPPGTVVDDIVTLPERYDFFIVSQCVRQGTVSPTSYNIIEDSMGLPADKLQILTYKLCHMYYNWSGTVRVPAPCQYAHKLAFLVSQSLHRTAAQNLDNTLYYL